MKWFLIWMLQFPNEDGTRKPEGWMSWERGQSPVVSFEECQQLWQIKIVDLRKQTKDIQYAGYKILCKKQL